ncbi:hypothetical protein [Paraburkholderia oxyphila]|uniref:hypothetical protein n=1 Tax=Paraburkholderia oxyphila TaxID=614212 RepID=UPI0012EE8FFB|nr:hypothetical protein [Paraburkholderia oxyphila]
MTGLVPARIEVRPCKRPDIKHSDLNPVEVTIYMKESKLKLRGRSERIRERLADGLVRADIDMQQAGAPLEVSTRRTTMPAVPAAELGGALVSHIDSSAADIWREHHEHTVGVDMARCVVYGQHLPSRYDASGASVSALKGLPA